MASDAVVALAVPPDVLARRFHELADQWKAQRGPTSAVEEMAMHPAYQQIIGMGPAAVPLLLAELQRQPDHWFWALKAITGEDPVPPADRGKLPKMAEAWLRWAEAHRSLPQHPAAAPPCESAR